MFCPKVLLQCLALASSISSVYGAPSLEKRVDDHPVSFKTIYVPPSNYRTPKTLYGRTAQLADGTLLATW